jgi:DNA-nicking Smr family endonuclease
VAKKKRDHLTEEDRRLWWHVTQSVAPLPGSEPVEKPQAARPAKRAASEKPEKPKPAPAVERGRLIHKPQVDPPRHMHQSLLPGQLNGVDHRLGRRLKRGQLPIEATLDLHGHRRDDAHAELTGFLAWAQGRGMRCLLVITGKGRRTPLDEERSVLKAMLPRWLNEPNNRNRILAFAHARPQHGGEGAFYVLLRKGHTQS